MSSRLAETIRSELKRLIHDVTTRLPDDVLSKIKYYMTAYEVPAAALKVLEAIVSNCEIAVRERVPLCQDTGVPMFMVSLGDDFPIRSGVYDIIRDVVVESTSEVPLRQNVVCPITNRPSENNVGRYIPWVEVDLVRGDHADIYYTPKGGGSELPCRALTVAPARGLAKLKRMFLKLLAKSHALPCPPLVVGIGIGATIDIAVRLAKRALFLRRIDQRSENEFIAELERELVELGNKLEVGPHGLGGRPTVLDVHIEYSSRHPATFSVAFVFSCWALRRGGIRVYSSGHVERIL